MNEDRATGTGDTVAGIDGTPNGWIGAELGPDGAVAFHWHRELARLVEQLVAATVIGVDIPIGLPASGYRRADEAARLFLGTRRSSVFLVPPEEALLAPSYQDARAVWRARGWKGSSRQAFALRHRILEAAAAARADDRIREVHPEVSFQLMRGNPLHFGKHSWNGAVERVGLLAAQGMKVALEPLAVSEGGVDDVLDAAAAAWSARRISRGDAKIFPTDSLENEPRIWG